jgi:hypothetical protein
MTILNFLEQVYVHDYLLENGCTEGKQYCSKSFNTVILVVT